MIRLEFDLNDLWCPEDYQLGDLVKSEIEDEIRRMVKKAVRAAAKEQEAELLKQVREAVAVSGISKLREFLDK